MNMPIIAGPWCGEFGWELFGWQAHLRWLKHKLGSPIIVASRSGHEHLYEDFCDHFIAFDPPGTETITWELRGWDNTILPLEIQTVLEGTEYVHIKPGPIPFENQTFVKFGQQDDLEKYHILLHIRNTNKIDGWYKNWPKSSALVFAERMKEKGLSLATIGTKVGAHGLEEIGIPDYRSINLKHLAQLMHNSMVVVGPSSGPLHLASLCGTPHVAFGDKAKYGAVQATLTERYQKLWNPFNTPATFIECADAPYKQWDPDINELENAVLNSYRMTATYSQEELCRYRQK